MASHARPRQGLQALTTLDIRATGECARRLGRHASDHRVPRRIRDLARPYRLPQLNPAAAQSGGCLAASQASRQRDEMTVGVRLILPNRVRPNVHRSEATLND
ncbi:hypothetical protein GCM10027259_51860 [Micromonospora palomenae]